MSGKQEHKGEKIGTNSKSYAEQVADARRAVQARGITKLAVSLESRDGRHIAPVLAETVEVVETDALILGALNHTKSDTAGVVPIATKNEGELAFDSDDPTATIAQAIQDDPRGLEIVATITGSTSDNTNPRTLAVIAPSIQEYAVTAKDGNGPRYGLGG
jgi:hypothetical protein